MKISLINISLFCLFALNRIYSQAPNSGDGFLDSCGGMHCWPKVFIPQGKLECGNYQTTLDEKFINLDNWEVSYPGNNIVHVPGEEQFYLENNVQIQNNKCILKGEYHPNTIMVNPQDGNQYLRDFTSGMIITKKDYHFGRYEATIDDMPGGGWWPAFWMHHHEEIDIMERFYEEFLYSYNSYPSTKSCPISSELFVKKSLFEGPHKFAAEWTPFKLTFFYNDEKLPVVIYRYYDFDAHPLNIECVDQISEGLYYENPAFPLPLRNPNSNANMEATVFRPIINLAVLMRFGGNCCGPGIVDCDLDGCLNTTCQSVCEENWGNPIDMNGNPVEGREPFTTMTISNVKIDERPYYKVCNSIFVKYEPIICKETSTIEVGAFGTLQPWPTHFVKLKQVNCSSNIIASFKTNTTWPDFSNLINLKVDLNTSNTGFFEIIYEDECGNTNKILKNVKIIGSNRPCSINACSSANNYECCPDGTFYDGLNCFYGTIPSGYSPFIFQNSFYVKPNCMISSDNNCCPAGYIFDGANCHSGINFPENREGFIYENGFYVRPKCGDLRDCCPRGPFKFDGANCFSGKKFPQGYIGFIYGNAFYVKPNCNVSTTNNCCPAGFTFDGANCHSGITFPSGYTGFIYENGFYVEPNCDIPFSEPLEYRTNFDIPTELDFIIVPNPSSRTIELVFNKSEIYPKVLISDLSQKSIVIDAQENESINISRLENGVYFISVITDSKIITKKFVKISE
jgi:hypothetical protein